jgi:hypothetical protein
VSVHVPKRGGGREKGNWVGWGFEEWLVCDVVLVVCRFFMLLVGSQHAYAELVSRSRSRSLTAVFSGLVAWRVAPPC